MYSGCKHISQDKLADFSIKNIKFIAFNFKWKTYCQNVFNKNYDFVWRNYKDIWKKKLKKIIILWAYVFLRLENNK